MREWNPLDSPETERFTWRCLWCGHTKEETFITEMGNRGFRCPNCKMQHYMDVDKKSSGVPFLRSLNLYDYKLDRDKTPGMRVTGGQMGFSSVALSFPGSWARADEEGVYWVLCPNCGFEWPLDYPVIRLVYGSPALSHPTEELPRWCGYCGVSIKWKVEDDVDG